MAEYCNKCSWKHGFKLPDFNLKWIAWKLKPEQTKYFICEGCDIHYLHKNKAGKLFLGKRIKGELKEIKVNYLNL